MDSGDLHLCRHSGKWRQRSPYSPSRVEHEGVMRAGRQRTSATGKEGRKGTALRLREAIRPNRAMACVTGPAFFVGTLMLTRICRRSRETTFRRRS